MSAEAIPENNNTTATHKTLFISIPLLDAHFAMSCHTYETMHPLSQDFDRALLSHTIAVSFSYYQIFLSKKITNSNKRNRTRRFQPHEADRLTDDVIERRFQTDMNGRTPEIVAPAGNFESGIYALKGGADAVYFGLSRFSARKPAENLTSPDVRRLKGFAEEHHKKIYAALNTVIAQDEIDDAMREVAYLALADVDGLILQDLGLADRIRHEFPNIPLHASTQLAVHTALGLKIAASLSFRRVVLSRELSIAEIALMKEVAPSVEREVFVHGALCYGFSGLCLASSQLTGRSGNRGECAQICRSWFEKESKKGYFFSASDLEAGGLVRKLEEAGVFALKIEGRLKSSAYAFNTAAYYRALLDGDGDKAAFFKNQSALTFARPQTSGYLVRPEKEKLIHAPYPSHMGIPGATVLSSTQKKMAIRALCDLASRDRLFRLPKGPPDEGETLVLSGFLSAGKRKHRIASGETAEVQAVSGVRAGDVLWKTLSHDIHLRSLSKGAFPEKKAPLTLKVSSSEGELHLETEILSKVVEASYPVIIEKSCGKKRFEDVLSRMFGECKDFGFVFHKIVLQPDEAQAAPDIFVPPSMLKAIRNDFYEKTRAAFDETSKADLPYKRLTDFAFPLPKRSDIRYENGFAFIAEGAVGSLSEWPLINEARFVSLPPIMFREQETVSSIASQIDAHPNEQFRVGLNNIAHLKVAEQWKTKKNVSFYIDFGLYAANLSALLFFIQNIEKLCGAYLWLEAKASQRSALEQNILSHLGKMPDGLRFIEEKERFPMFLSRICFHRSLQKEQRCPAECPKSYVYPLKQNRRSLEVRVIDCVSYVHLVTKPTRITP